VKVFRRAGSGNRLVFHAEKIERLRAESGGGTIAARELAGVLE
jgi:hypothetical protein